MSLATWKRKYYPVPADTEMSVLDAIKHSLRKWKGLRLENLQAHNLTRVRAERYIVVITDNKRGLRISTASCALCVMFYPKDGSEQHNCVDCPLYDANGRRRCDEDNENGVNLFFIWNNTESQDPEPMIAALKHTLARQIRLEKKYAAE
jgi:hypothetical protein